MSPCELVELNAAAQIWPVADMQAVLEGFVVPLLGSRIAGNALLFKASIGSPHLAGPDAVNGIAAGPLTLLLMLAAVAALMALCCCGMCEGRSHAYSGGVFVGVCSLSDCRRGACCGCCNGDDAVGEEGDASADGEVGSWCCCPGPMSRHILPPHGGPWPPRTRFWYGRPWWTPLWPYDVDVRRRRLPRGRGAEVRRDPEATGGDVHATGRSEQHRPPLGATP